MDGAFGRLKRRRGAPDRSEKKKAGLKKSDAIAHCTIDPEKRRAMDETRDAVVRACKQASKPLYRTKKIREEEGEGTGRGAKTKKARRKQRINHHRTKRKKERNARENAETSSPRLLISFLMAWHGMSCRVVAPACLPYSNGRSLLKHGQGVHGPPGLQVFRPMQQVLGPQRQRAQFVD